MDLRMEDQFPRYKLQSFHARQPKPVSTFTGTNPLTLEEQENRPSTNLSKDNPNLRTRATTYMTDNLWKGRHQELLRRNDLLL